MTDIKGNHIKGHIQPHLCLSVRQLHAHLFRGLEMRQMFELQTQSAL